MDRRAFLARAALVSGGALAGAAVAPVASLATAAPIWADNPGNAGVHAVDDRLTAATVRWRVDTEQRLVALTFDDGPVPDYTIRVLDALRAAGVRATFFLIGRHVERNPDLARREVDEGHELGNHTWSHPDLSTLEVAAATAELTRAHEAIVSAAGVTPRHHRPPYGHVGGASLLAAARLGYDVALWDIQLHETVWNAAGNAAYVAGAVRPGSIVLAHDTGNTSRLVDVQALPALVAGVRDRGFEFVTLSELTAAART